MQENKLGETRASANGGTDFLLEDKFLFPLKIKETKRKNCPVKAEQPEFKKIIEGKRTGREAQENKKESLPFLGGILILK